MTEARLSDEPDRFAEGTPERLKHDVFVREKVIEHLQTEIAAMKAASEQAAQQIASLTDELVVVHNTCGQYEEEAARSREQISALTQERDMAQAHYEGLGTIVNGVHNVIAGSEVQRDQAETRLKALQGALQQMVEKWQAEFQRIGRINTDEQRERVIPELLGFMWLKELRALLSVPQEPPSQNKERI